MNKPTVTIGAQKLLAGSKHLKKGVRVGLICNPTSILPNFSHLADRMIDHPDIELVALFGPEHGFYGAAQDQVGVEGTTYRGVPVHSLYRQTEQSLAPTDPMLDACDLLVFDIQDVGSRYYTYVWTMTECMALCARVSKPLLVCDRPNPINGLAVEGPLLQKEFASFVGRHPVCTRHGMTAGEIARMVNAETEMGCVLSVARCEGWDRGMWFDQCDLPWVMPSPNMPTVDTATVYPGGCLIEGTNLSEGRGTTCPFQIIGAPFLDGFELARRLSRLDLPGVVFRPIVFEPVFHKHAGLSCGGVFVHVTDRERFLPVTAYLALIIEARSQALEHFAWRTEPYEFESGRPAIDLLFGEDQTRQAIESGEGAQAILERFDRDAADFLQRRESFLLY